MKALEVAVKRRFSTLYRVVTNDPPVLADALRLEVAVSVPSIGS